MSIIVNISNLGLYECAKVESAYVLEYLLGLYNL